MEKIKDKFEKEVAKINKRVNILILENEDNHKQLSVLEKEYADAVVTSNENAPKIKLQLKELKINIQDADEEMKILTDNAQPQIERAANKAANEISKRIDKYRSESEKEEKEIEKARSEYLGILAKAQINSHAKDNEAGIVTSILQQASKEIVEELNITGYANSFSDGRPRHFNFYPFLVSETDFYSRVREIGNFNH